MRRWWRDRNLFPAAFRRRGAVRKSYRHGVLSTSPGSASAVIADIRKAVFEHVLSLTPALFEITRTGEVLSRLTADTTLIQTVVGSSVSMALRNLLMLVGGLALMFATSIKLTLDRARGRAACPRAAHPLRRWVRALSRASQDRIADTSARASETINAVQTVQAFTQENAERHRFGAPWNFVRRGRPAYARSRGDDGAS